MNLDELAVQRAKHEEEGGYQKKREKNRANVDGP